MQDKMEQARDDNFSLATTHEVDLQSTNRKPPPYKQWILHLDIGIIQPQSILRTKAWMMCWIGMSAILCKSRFYVIDHDRQAPAIGTRSGKL
jgi:hypothetical protein